MPKAKTWAIVLIFLGACGVLIVLSCAGLVYFGATNTESIASERVDMMFDAIEAGTFGDKYETDMTQECRDLTSKEEYKALGDAVREQLGPLQSKRVTSLKAKNFNGVSFITVSYRGRFEKDNGKVTVHLKNEDDKWKFVGFHVNSRALTSLQKTKACASCGAAHDTDAKFCPSCGKETTQDEAQRTDAAEPIVEAE